MAKVHLMEFWPYLCGLSPAQVQVTRLQNIMGPGSHRASPGNKLAGLATAPAAGITLEMREDVEKTWEEARSKNPNLINNPKPMIISISRDGCAISTALSDYKTSFWIKTKLSSYSFGKQEAMAKQFPFLNIGLVTVTSDNKILMERRPEGFTAHKMLLNYPAGHANPEHKTLAYIVNSQCEGELGFSAFDGQGSYSKQMKRIYSIGMQRESCEWTPTYSFIAELTVPFASITPTKETRHISFLPADTSALSDKIIELYSPACKGDVAGKLVPNAACMLASYVREVAGREKYGYLMARLAKAAKTVNYELKAIEYTPTTSPFA